MKSTRTSRNERHTRGVGPAIALALFLSAVSSGCGGDVTSSTTTATTGEAGGQGAGGQGAGGQGAGGQGAGGQGAGGQGAGGQGAGAGGQGAGGQGAGGQGAGGQGGSAPTCDDGMLDQGETDVDCGGPCEAKCPDGGGCDGPEDCESKVCLQGVCAAPACNDSVKNGDEKATDCGGSCPAPCGLGMPCDGPEECISMACVDGLCACVPQPGSLTPTPTIDEDCNGVFDESTTELRWVVVDPSPNSVSNNGCPFDVLGMVGDACSPAGCPTTFCWVDGGGNVVTICGGSGYGPATLPGGSAECKEVTVYY